MGRQWHFGTAHASVALLWLHTRYSTAVALVKSAPEPRAFAFLAPRPAFRSGHSCSPQCLAVAFVVPFDHRYSLAEAADKDTHSASAAELAAASTAANCMQMLCQTAAAPDT